MFKPLVALVLAASAFAAEPLSIPLGKAITVDGRISAGEWDDAKKTSIVLPDKTTVRVAYKHDAENLYFLLSDLPEGVFPELLIDAKNAKSENWISGQLWLHASANDCEGDGEFNVYRRDGKFVCAKEKPGWEANNWPLPEKTIEIRVSFAKAGITTKHKGEFGLAIDLTNTKDMWAFLPADAKLESPKSWGTAKLEWK